MRSSLHQKQNSAWLSIIGLLFSLAAAVIIFVPFAAKTSPWDAVTLRVPGEQGNWWHLLIGVPFLLAIPMIWLRLRSIFSLHSSAPPGRLLVYILAALSACGTIVVELPFVLRLGNYAHLPIERQLSAIVSGLGPLLVCGAILLIRYRNLSSIDTCFLALNGAYLANAALCLLFYAPMRESGWTVVMIVGWFMVLEIAWIFLQSFRAFDRPSSDTEVDPLAIA